MALFRHTDPVFAPNTDLAVAEARSSWVSIADGSRVSFQVYWTGTDVGSFAVQISNHPKPTDLDDSDAVTAPTSFAGDPDGSASGIAYVELETVGRWARILYTQSASAGGLVATETHYLLKGV